MYYGVLWGTFGNFGIPWTRVFALKYFGVFWGDLRNFRELSGTLGFFEARTVWSI